MSADERRPFHFHQRGNGWAAEGPGFYVWDEDAKEVTRVALRLVAQSRRPREEASHSEAVASARSGRRRRWIESGAV